MLHRGLSSASRLVKRYFLLHHLVILKLSGLRHQFFVHALCEGWGYVALIVRWRAVRYRTDNDASLNPALAAITVVEVICVVVVVVSAATVVTVVTVLSVAEACWSDRAPSQQRGENENVFHLFFLHELLLLLILVIHRRVGLLPSRPAEQRSDHHCASADCEWTRTYRGTRYDESCMFSFFVMLVQNRARTCSVMRELLSLRQLQVGTGFFHGKPVSKTHRASTEAAIAVAAKHGQALKMEGCGGAVTAVKFPQTTQFGGGREFSEAGERGVLLRMNGECSRTAEMAFCLTYEQITGQYRNDHALR
jgi:hypothetical protein